MRLPTFTASPFTRTPRHPFDRTFQLSIRRQPQCKIFPASPNIPIRLPVLILPGLGNSSADYTKLASQLAARGHTASVVPIARWQWSLNARGFFTRDYWRATLRPNQVLNWYFDRVDKGVNELRQVVAESSIHVVGHSAGGWLARAYLAERAPDDMRVEKLVTLGTPSTPPQQGKLDQTRGLLAYVERKCSMIANVKEMVCVAGSGTIGKPIGKGSIWEYIAFLSYAAVCGRGDVDGDGVTPLQAACAKDGKLVVCEQCSHSMLTSPQWYGSGKAFEKWSEFLS